MKNKLILLTASLALATLTVGCATSGGRQESSREATFAQDDQGQPTGSASITNHVDTNGVVTSVTVNLANVSHFIERDRSKVGARGLLAIQEVRDFKHERRGFLGSNSKSGVDAYKADPDEAAIKSVAENLAEIRKLLEALKGAPVPTP